mmetsp:Transcript_31089/g.61557  ORF Transcript_31089/g.61557 Transcript_31089/m.61557 type:complete len:204 (-) Transcript_31089:247-858(-)
MQCRVFARYPARLFRSRMCCMILCSPSPGTSCPLNTTSSSDHVGSDAIFFRMKYWIVADTRPMKSVPGVMQFESNAAPSCSLISSPAARAAVFFSASASDRSRALRNRRDRCWFSLARGATPSTAMYTLTFGRTIWVTMRSRYATMPVIISRSLREVDTSMLEGWVHPWMMPFMSRYRWSNSGRRALEVRTWLMCGYRSDSQR